VKEAFSFLPVVSVARKRKSPAKAGPFLELWGYGSVAVTVAWPVSVSVGEFFLLRLSDLLHADREMQALAGERVVAVENDALELHFLDRDRDGHAPRPVHRQLHSFCRLDIRGQLGLRNLETAARVVLAVPVLRLYDDLDLIADALPEEGALQAGDDVFVPVEIVEGLSADARIEGIPLIVLQRVLDGRDNVFLDLHGSRHIEEPPRLVYGISSEPWRFGAMPVYSGPLGWVF
jgi:hypothetical protein